MSQLVRLEGKHTTQNAHCAVVTNMSYEIVQTKNVKGRRAITLFNTSSGDIDTYFISFFNFLSNLKISAIESIVN